MARGRSRTMVGKKKGQKKGGGQRAVRRAFRSKRGAYAPVNKRFVKRLTNPLAENKQVLGSELSATVGLDVDGKVVLTDYSMPPIDAAGNPTGAGGHSMNTPHFHFNPDSMLYQTQGLDESQMIGRSTYQTICAAKFLIKWPQPTMNTGITNGAGSGKIFGAIPDQPMNYKLYWGYVPKKLLFTNETDPVANGASAFNIEQAINQRVSDYFNDRTDRIQFIPKKTSTIRIIGSRKLSPPWNHRSGRMPVSTVQMTSDGEGKPVNSVVHQGEIPDTLVKVKWNINRKIHFEPSNTFGHRPADPDAYPDPTPAENIALANGSSVFYRNYDWLPFAVIVSYNHDKLPENDPDNANPDLRDERTRRCPQVLINDITYYRDS